MGENAIGVGGHAACFNAVIAKFMQMYLDNVYI